MSGKIHTFWESRHFVLSTMSHWISDGPVLALLKLRGCARLLILTEC